MARKPERQYSAGPLVSNGTCFAGSLLVVFSDSVKARYRAAGWWRDATYVDDFAAQVATRPDKVAIVSHKAGSDAPPEHTTYAQLGDAVDRIARGLLALGVQRGEVVSAQMSNRWEFAAIVLACARAGAVASPLIPIYRHRELRFMIGRTESRVCIVPRTFRGFDHAAMIEELAPDLPALKHTFVLGETFEPWFLDQRHDVSLDGLAVGPDELAELQFTSGTTGEPKGVQHTPNTIWAGTRLLGELLKLVPEDVTLMASTLAHQTGFLYGIVFPLATGQTVIYQDVWDATVFGQLIEEYGVTFSMGATPFVADAVAAQQAKPRRIDTLRAYLCAGAPIPPNLVKACNEVLGCELLAAWGMTENAAVTACALGSPPEVVAESDGVAAPWMEVRVVDDSGTELAQGEVGRLQVRGANQTPGYYKRPDLYEAALMADPGGGEPWFETGDLAWRRADGGIRIAGRSKDLVIRGGRTCPWSRSRRCSTSTPRCANAPWSAIPTTDSAREPASWSSPKTPRPRPRWPSSPSISTGRAWPNSSGPNAWRSSPRCPEPPPAKSRSSSSENASQPTNAAPPGADSRFETFDGWWHGELRLSPDDGALVRQAIERRVGRMLNSQRQGDPTSETLSIHTLRAQALVDLADQDLRSGPGQQTRPDRYHIALTMAVDADGNVAPVGPLPAGALCDANFYRLVVGPESQPLDIGRAQRSWPAPLATAIIRRDRHCRFPGCDAPPSHCDIHHCNPGNKAGTRPSATGCSYAAGTTRSCTANTGPSNSTTSNNPHSANPTAADTNSPHARPQEPRPRDRAKHSTPRTLMQDYWLQTRRPDVIIQEHQLEPLTILMRR